MRIENLPSIFVKESLLSRDSLGSLVGAEGAGGGLDAPAELPGAPGASFRSQFASQFRRAVSEIEGKMRVAESERQRVLAGDVNSLHQATIAASEAGVAFSLMVEVRNKLVESYQELMRMQV